MVHVTDRAKEVLLEKKRSENINAEQSELLLAGRTVDCRQTGGMADLVLTAPSGGAPRQK